jgi:modulator of FtsH protease HflC
MKRNLPFFALLGAIFLFVLSLSAYTVDQRKATIKFRLGEAIAIQKEPGLYFKVPFLDKLKTYDNRIQTLDPKDPERVQTAEKNNVLVDSFVKYRIIDVKQFFVSTGGDLSRAELRLSQAINEDLRGEFGQRTLAEAISGDRQKLMDSLQKKADINARSMGIEVLDVRIKRVDLPSEINNQVYKRMESERTGVANKLRSTGIGEAEQIKADAERQRTIILADAYRDAQKIKGEGDAEAVRITAAAFGRNPEFYSFYRSMDAYRESFRNKSDVMVLDTNSDFFKYLKSPGKGR